VSRLFEFVQFEFTHAIGPPAGRYLVGSDGAEPRAADDLPRHQVRRTGETATLGLADVLVVGVLPAPASRPRLRRKARDATPGATPVEVPLSLVTFVGGTAPLKDADEARRSLGAIRASEDEQEERVQHALRVLNVAIRAYRAGAHDPYVIEVTRRDPRCVRIGYGTTEDVQDGRWQAAVELPPPVRLRSTRLQRLQPSQAVADALSGRGGVLEAEDVILRALVDLDHDRTRAAAYQVRAAMDLLALELGPDIPVGKGRPAFADLAAAAQRLADAAGDGPLDETQVKDLDDVIAGTDELLDAWRYEGAE
jgi:hypothetical protein